MSPYILYFFYFWTDYLIFIVLLLYVLMHIFGKSTYLFICKKSKDNTIWSFSKLTNEHYEYSSRIKFLTEKNLLLYAKFMSNIPRNHHFQGQMIEIILFFQMLWNWYVCTDNRVPTQLLIDICYVVRTDGHYLNFRKATLFRKRCVYHKQKVFYILTGWVIQCSASLFP